MNIIKGKRVVITGPTSGIGEQIAIQLSAFGAALVLGCRVPGNWALYAVSVRRLIVL